MQSYCRNFRTPGAYGFKAPQVVRTQYLAKGCGEDFQTVEGQKWHQPDVQNDTKCLFGNNRQPKFVGMSWSKAGIGRRRSLSVSLDLCGLDQHNRDVVLNGIDAAALPASQAFTIRVL
jgi:hypothetical protein